MISKIISRADCLRELASNPKSFSNCPNLHGGVPDLPEDRICTKRALEKKQVGPPAICSACALKFAYALVVADHVYDHAVRVSNKEPADAPRLIRQRVNDLKAKSDSLRMHRVNVIDLNGHVRLWLGRSGLLHERDLSRWIARRDERDNPIHVNSHVEAQETCVELPALMNLVAGDIWYNSSDAHRIPFFLVRSNLQKRDFARRLC